MNPLIKELASKALKQPDTDNDGLTVFDNDELEKFAELIRVLNERPLVQPKYWVSLSDSDKIDCANYDYRDQCVEATERKLRKLNEVQQRKTMPLKEVERVLYVNTKLNPNLRDDQELIGYIVNSVRAIEAAHGIKE